MTMRVDGRDAAEVARAAGLLAAGELVAFPTETVYGLGARADDDAAVAKIFALKGRPSGHPLIVHVAGREDAGGFGELSPLAERIVDAFWPGPVTVIVRRRPGAAEAAAAGQATIGLRCPAHPVAHARGCSAEKRVTPHGEAGLLKRTIASDATYSVTGNRIASRGTAAS